MDTESNAPGYHPSLLSLISVKFPRVLMSGLVAFGCSQPNHLALVAHLRPKNKGE